LSSSTVRAAEAFAREEPERVVDGERLDNAVQVELNAGGDADAPAD
jgi:hypothetical protein